MKLEENMVKIMPLLLILTITCVLTQGQSIQYLQNKLTVEVENKIIASYSEWNELLTESIQIGKAGLVIKESKKWDGYKGGFKISEWDFFETAGLSEQAQSSKNYHGTTKFLIFGGLGTTIAGLAMCAIGSKGFTKTYEYWDTMESILCYGGFSSFCVGATLTIIGGTRSGKVFPVSFAIEVADDYNKRLRKSLE